MMGNNQLMLLQFPRTYYFFATAWDKDYESRAGKRCPCWIWRSSFILNSKN